MPKPKAKKLRKWQGKMWLPEHIAGNTLPSAMRVLCIERGAPIVGRIPVRVTIEPWPAKRKKVRR